MEYLTAPKYVLTGRRGFDPKSAEPKERWAIITAHSLAVSLLIATVMSLQIAHDEDVCVCVCVHVYVYIQVHMVLFFLFCFLQEHTPSVTQHNARSRCRSGVDCKQNP